MVVGSDYLNNLTSYRVVESIIIPISYFIGRSYIFMSNFNLQGLSYKCSETFPLNVVEYKEVPLNFTYTYTTTVDTEKLTTGIK